MPTSKIGPYEIGQPLGEGGMGIVFAAHDPRLGRRVAIKMIRTATADPTARERLWREARAAASVNHPNVCQVYDVGEHEGDLYIAMELLEGEAIATRIARGPVAVTEALEITCDILGALDALHARGFIHRDLKPSNVFLTPHGVKLLDFGLARSVIDDLQQIDVQLTMPGTAVGTPRYMAPEMWHQEPLGPACDVFAVGALLFEMLAGRPAFPGDKLLEVYRAILNEQPPALTGGPEIEAVDGIVQRALAKQPADRYATAGAMAEALREVRAVLSTGSVPTARVGAPRRLIVLPFRVLRPDPEIDFLSFSLPDAITTSLRGIESVVVRSSAAAQRYGDASPDLGRIANEADVDAVVYGTLLRAGDQVRVSAQLAEAPSGTLLTTRSAQVELRDIFQLQDELTREIVQTLAGELSTGESARLQHDRPSNPRAYELYLRANQFADNNRLLAEARDLYEACLREDDGYAPAWARLGRVYRVMAKYGMGSDGPDLLQKAETAFQRALALNPDLSLAHNLYTYFELEELGRSIPCMVRLLERARSRRSDPELYAGLVLTCRFCGLLDASVAADHLARRLDPGARTSVQYTYWMRGEWEKAMLYDEEHIRFVVHYTLPMIGREAEAIQRCRELEASHLPGLQHQIFAGLRAAMEGEREECLAACNELRAGFHDPEGLMYLARCVARVGEPALALDILEDIVSRGFYCGAILERDPWLDSVHGEPRFAAVRERAEAGRRAAQEAYTRAGGPEILGVAAS